MDIITYSLNNITILIRKHSKIDLYFNVLSNNLIENNQINLIFNENNFVMNQSGIINKNNFNIIFYMNELEIVKFLQEIKMFNFNQKDSFYNFELIDSFLEFGNIVTGQISSYLSKKVKSNIDYNKPSIIDKKELLNNLNYNYNTKTLIKITVSNMDFVSGVLIQIDDIFSNLLYKGELDEK